MKQSKWIPTEEDLKDCGHCRGGWPLILHNGYRAHRSAPDAEITPCFSTGPLRLAPVPKRDYVAIKKFFVTRLGYFLVGDAFLAIVVGFVLLVLKGVHLIVAALPGGVDQALEYTKRGAIAIVIGITAIRGITAGGEYLWNTFTKSAKKEESTT